MSDLAALGLEPGTVVSLAWAAVYGPPCLPGWTFVRVPEGWRASRVSGARMSLDKPAPVVQYRKRAA